MKVYPVNLLNEATSFTSNVVTFSNIKNTIHKYMKHRAWYAMGATPVINISFRYGVYADTFIVADTNCKKISVTIQYSEGQAFIESVLNKDSIFIFPIANDRPVMSINITLSSEGLAEQPYLGYLFLGNAVELPRFTTNPMWETNIRGSSNRTRDGQVYGNLLPTLDVLRVSFIRIYKDKKKIIEDYLQSVQNVLPHVVDLYPEAHEDFPPRYATLERGIGAQKRAESNFYWNFNLEWMEAR